MYIIAPGLLLRAREHRTIFFFFFIGRNLLSVPDFSPRSSSCHVAALRHFEIGAVRVLLELLLLLPAQAQTIADHHRRRGAPVLVALTLLQLQLPQAILFFPLLLPPLSATILEPHLKPSTVRCDLDSTDRGNRVFVFSQLSCFSYVITKLFERHFFSCLKKTQTIIFCL